MNVLADSVIYRVPLAIGCRDDYLELIPEKYVCLQEIRDGILNKYCFYRYRLGKCLRLCLEVH